MATKPGKLYLIPAPLGDNALDPIPEYVKPAVASLTHFVVEQEKTARRYLKAYGYPHPLNDLVLYPLNKHTTDDEIMEYILPMLAGTSMGLISEAGMPCIADPGATIVEMAHQSKIQVVPLSGPSSILLALVASGFNGQEFAFNGYLPIKHPERKQKLQELERLAQRGQTQLFMDTPFRNKQLLDDLIQCCRPDTRLCIACDLTLETEYIRTMSLSDWKKSKENLHKRPAIFILGR